MEVTFCRKTHGSLVPYHSKQDNLYFCNDLNEIMSQRGDDHPAIKWRIFTDTSKKSLNAALLHVGHNLPYLLLAFSAHSKETLDVRKLVLEEI